MIKGGYVGKILRVDLTEETVREEALPDERILRNFVGGVGLAAKYLYEEVPPKVQPLDPENRLIFMTGPLTGTAWPCSSRHAVMTIHGDIPKSGGAAWGGGFWAAKLKMLGYDAIIIQGAARKPTYLLMNESGTELRDASHLWGKDTHETEEFLRQELSDPSASVVAIGPAGENLVSGALMANDRNHHACKAGGGKVMGSKKLKCIAISKKKLRFVPVADPNGFMKVVAEYRKKMNPGGVMQQFLRDGGAVRHYAEFADGWTVLIKNCTDEMSQKPWAEEMVNTIKQSELLPRACFNCPIRCAHDITIGKGPYKGYRTTLCGGLENLEGVGGMLGIMEGGTVLYITDLLDRLGLDTGLIGLSLGVLYESYEKELIGKTFTDDLELKWGNADAAINLIHKTVRREGIGQLIAQGPKVVAKAIGGEAEQFMSGVKGVQWAHDPRKSWEIILARAMSSCGAAREGYGADGLFPDPEVGFPEKPPPFNKERAPFAVSLTQKRSQWENCLGICAFSTGSIEGSLGATFEALSLAVGWPPYTKEEAFLVADRFTNLMRLFNVGRGMTMEDDLDIGAKWLDGFKYGPYAGNPLRPHIEEFIQRYYGYMGWDGAGKPTKETVKRLGLDELANKV